MTYVPNQQTVTFFARMVQPVLEEIISEKCSFPEITGAYQENRGFIIAHYSKMFSISCHDKPSPDFAGKNMLLPMGCNANSDIPTVCIFVPTLEKISHELRQQNPKKYESQFRSFLIVGFMHELDHLALKMAGKRNSSLEEIIEIESNVWARTCEKTIRPLIEKHDICISPGDLFYYKAWVRGGRMINGREWKEYIANTYGNLKRI